MTTDAKAPEPEEFPEEEGRGPDLTVLVLYGIARSRLWVATSVFLGLIVAILYAFSLPNTYTSEGRLRLTAGKRETLTAEASAGLDETQITPAMADELILLTSEGVFRKAAEDIGPLRILKPVDPRQGDDEGTAVHVRLLHEIQAAVLAARTRHLDDPDETREELLVSATKVLRANTQVLPVPTSNVITVLVTATSPSSARDFTNTLMQRCIEEHRQAYAIEGLLETNRAKRLSVQQEYVEAQEAYTAHVDECGFVHLTSQMPTLINLVTTQESTLESLRAEYVAKQARHEDLVASLESMPRTVEQTRLPTLGPNVQITRLEELMRDTRLEMIRTVYEPGLASGSREQYERYFEALLDAISGELDGLPTVVEVVPSITEEVSNPDYEALSRITLELQAEVQGLSRRIEQLEISLERQREKLGRARVCEPIHGVLERDLRDKQLQLEKLADVAGELELLGLLEQQGDSNLRTFQPATLPRQKDGPKRTKLVLMGLAAGAGLGIAAAILRQLLDGHVRYPRTLERDLGLPVLATVAELPSTPISPARPQAAAPRSHEERAARA